MRLLILLSFLSTVGYGQMSSMDYLPISGAGGATRFNSYTLGRKTSERLDYSEIKGSCFSDGDWSAALLVLIKGGNVKLKNVKLNLYSNDIHYLDDRGIELVASAGITAIIFFDKKDSTKVTSVFQRLAIPSEQNKEFFGQVLAGKEIQLVKQFKISLVTEVDPVTSKSEYRFRTTSDYLIIDHKNISQLKGLNKASILSVIKPTKEQEEWLQSNKNKLKSEADAVAFIMYCNSAPQSR